MPELNLGPLKNDANLQGYWRFEADGTDSGPNGYNLTNNNTCTFVAAKYGNGVNVVKGSSQSMSITTAPNLNITGSRTMGGWVKPVAFTSDTHMLTKGADTHHLYIQAGDGKAVLNLSGLTTNAFVISTAVSTIGNLYFIVGRYDSVAQKLSITHYTVDGIRTYTEVSSSGSCTSETGTFRVGYDGSSFSTAVYDDLFVMNRALSDAEITALFKQSSGLLSIL